MEKRRNQQQQGGQMQQSDASRQNQQGSASGQQGGARMGQEHQTDMQRGSQQGGGQDTARQQHQFDRGTSQQGGGSGTTSRFADQIREHMPVIDSSGQQCGTVDHVEGDRIKLSRSGSPDGQHHYVPLSQVTGIEGGKVCLRDRGDNVFGMEGGR